MLKDASPETKVKGSSASQGQIIRWASLYDILVTTLTLGREHVFREAVLDLARISPRERVLDVGCGTGTLALAARRRIGAGDGTVHGVDAAAEMVRKAKHKACRANLDVAFDIAPAQALPFEDDTFDIVLCTLVMHHLPGDGRNQAIAEMHRVLRPQGRLLVVDFAHEHGLLAALDLASLIHGNDDMHTVDEALTLMRNTGFSHVASGKLDFRNMGYVTGRKQDRQIWACEEVISLHQQKNDAH